MAAKSAERVIDALNRAGGVDIPREFVIMDRAAIGLGAVFLRLQAEVNWHRLFNQVIADFDRPRSRADRPSCSRATSSRCRDRPHAIAGSHGASTKGVAFSSERLLHHSCSLAGQAPTQITDLDWQAPVPPCHIAP